MITTRSWKMDSSEDMQYPPWTAIVITCTSDRLREGLEEEYKRLSRCGLLPSHDLLLVVTDPQVAEESENGSNLSRGVGSGGATINALLVVVERLSAQLNHTTIRSELVYNSRILVVHHGRSFVHSPGGTAFLRISPEQSYVPNSARAVSLTVLQHAVWMATKVSMKSKTGVWVTSLDTFIPFSSSITPPDTEGKNGAIVCTVSAPFEHASHHGIVISGTNTEISRMEYKMPIHKMKETVTSSSASVISGLVFLSASLTEQLLALHTIPPLDRCTYYGTDSGVPPLQVSLYFDLLLPLCSGVSFEEYISGQCGEIYAQTEKYGSFLQQESHTARLQIWKQLQGLRATVHHLEGVHHQYLTSDLSFQSSVLPLLPSSVSEQDKFPTDMSDSCVLTMNSCVEGCVKAAVERLFVIDSWIGKDVTISTTNLCCLAGLQLQDSKLNLTLSGRNVWQMYPQEGTNVVTCHGMTDCLSLPWQDNEATIFSFKWPSFLEKTGIEAKDLWPTVGSLPQTAVNAKLFPSDLPVTEQMTMLALMTNALVNNAQLQEWRARIHDWRKCKRISLLDAVNNYDVKKITQDRKRVYLEMVKQYIRETADEVGGKSFLPHFCIVTENGDDSVKEILAVIHQQLKQSRPSTTRLLANIADLLGCWAAGKGGLRSGPAANPQWKNALMELKVGNLSEAVGEMSRMCQQWMDSGRPEDLIRAARHYERAAQIVISRQVETARVHVSPMWASPELRKQVDVGVWVEAHSPARIDLAGGWTDTPPICYEQGGAVLNIAIKINGKKPIGTRMRFVPEPHIVCVIRDWAGGDLRLPWTELEQLRDYDNPVSPGALVKAVLVYCHLVDLDSDESLKLQLENKYNGGIEVEVWSRLPQGSGLGGSSLLAGTMVAALAVLLGYPRPQHSHLIHATLAIEQRLTTGGGWQDQVGGLIGGAKLGVSVKGTPLTVTSYDIPLSPEFVELVNNHLLLLYTGKVRLARNLLQTVIRNWYARDPIVTSSFSQLKSLAVKAAGAMLTGDLRLLGSCIDTYWSLKKMVASGCEPDRVTKLMSSLRPHCLGMCLAGAGGGGYMFALKANANPLPDTVNLGGLSSDRVEMDQQGLELWVAEELVPQHMHRENTLTKDKWQELTETKW